jgi:hypothetical protein
MIEFLENEDVKNLIFNSASYQKSAETGLKKIKFETYVKDGPSVRLESAPFLPGVVIARNLGVIGQIDGKDIYNEWPITVEVAEKNYGKEVIDGLTENISWHKKKATIKAIELTEVIMEKLGVKGDTLLIKVSWSPEPMTAKIGDFITDGGYSVSAHDMKSTYEVIGPTKVSENIEKLRNVYLKEDKSKSLTI